MTDLRPTVGGDRDTWGMKLLSLIGVSTNNDGTLKAAAVQAALGGSLSALSSGGPPTSGSYVANQFYVDVNGVAWRCTADGTPGTWSFYGIDFMPGIISEDSTVDYGAIINAYMAAMAQYTDTPKLPPGTVYCATEVIPPAGVVLVGSKWSENATSVKGTQLKPQTSGLARLASCSNADSGFRNIIINGLSAGAGNAATKTFGVYAAHCKLDHFAAVGGSTTVFDANSSATNLDLEFFVIQSTGGVTRALNVAGSDWIVTAGRISSGTIVFNGGGNQWANVHFVGANSGSATPFTDNGGQRFTGCYFDSMPASATKLIDRSGAGSQSLYTGCHFYQNATGLSSSSMIFQETSTAGAGVLVMGATVSSTAGATAAPGYFIKGAIASTEVIGVKADIAFQTGFSFATPPLGFFVGCFNNSVPAALGGAVTGTNQTKPVYVAGQSAVQVAHTGDLTETALATIAIPAALIGANGRVVVKYHFSRTNNGNAHSMRVRFGASGAGTGGTQLALASPASVVQLVGVIDFANRNAQNSQIVSANGLNSGYGTSTSAVTTAAIDTSAASEVCITGQLATSSADTIAIESYQVLVYPG